MRISSLLPIFFLAFAGFVFTAQAETYISVSAHSGGNTVISGTEVYRSEGRSSGSVVVVVDGETVIDVHRTSDDAPITIEAEFPLTEVRSTIAPQTSGTEVTLERSFHVRMEDNDPPKVIHTLQPQKAVLAPLPDPSHINSVMDDHITNLIHELRDSASDAEDVAKEAEPLPFVAPLWSHAIMSVARTMAYVTSFLFL